MKAIIPLTNIFIEAQGLPPAVFVDHPLTSVSSLFLLGRTDLPEVAVTPFPVKENFDVIEHIS